MQTTIQKWGNSLAVRIPKAFVREAHVTCGTRVDLSVNDGKIVIDPHTEPKYNLDELLRGVTKRNLHAEVSTGKTHKASFLCDLPEYTGTDVLNKVGTLLDA